MRTVTGLFDDYADASSAVSELEALGVPSSDISIVSNNSDRRHEESNAAEGAGTGAGIGAVVGALFIFLAIRLRKRAGEI